jgi:hypothetical protein
MRSNSLAGCFALAATLLAESCRRGDGRFLQATNRLHLHAGTYGLSRQRPKGDGKPIKIRIPRPPRPSPPAPPVWFFGGEHAPEQLGA